MPEFATPNGALYYDILGPDDDSDHYDLEWLVLIHNFMSTGQAAWGVVERSHPSGRLPDDSTNTPRPARRVKNDEIGRNRIRRRVC